MNPSHLTEINEYPSKITEKVLYHNITKVSKKKLKVINSVRSFWVKYLKPELESHPEICMSNIFRDIVKVKEVSIKKIKEIVHKELTKNGSFKTVVKFSQQVLDIFRRNPQIEEEYPRHTKKLMKYCEEILKTKEDKVVVTKIEVKEEEESACTSFSSLLASMHGSSSNCTCHNYPILNGVVAIPVEFLVRLQDQISYIIQQNQIKNINVSDNQSLC